MEDEGIIIPTRVQPPAPSRSHSTTLAPNPAAFFGAGFNTNPFNAPSAPNTPYQQMQLHQPTHPLPTSSYPINNHEPTNPTKKQSLGETNFFEKTLNADFLNTFPEELQQVRLSKLSSDGLYAILQQIDDLRPTVEKLGAALSLNAINGRVLMHCDLAELKSVCENGHIIYINRFGFVC